MVRAFGLSSVFLLLSAPAMAAPAHNPEQLEMEQAIQEAADAAMTEMFQPGPAQPGWDKGGVDIYQLLESQAGGLSGSYLLTIDKDGDRSVRIVGANKLGDLVPKQWKPVMRAGTGQLPPVPEILEFAGLDGPFYVAGWESHRRVGDAFCSHGKMSVGLYQTSGEIAGEIPAELIPAFFNAIVTRIESQQLCWRYDRDGDAYKVTYFLEDGRTLPEMNEYSERATIVPAASIETLLAPTR